MTAIQTCAYTRLFWWWPLTLHCLQNSHDWTKQVTSWPVLIPLLVRVWDSSLSGVHDLWATRSDLPRLLQLLNAESLAIKKHAIVPICYLWPEIAWHPWLKHPSRWGSAWDSAHRVQQLGLSQFNFQFMILPKSHDWWARTTRDCDSPLPETSEA